MSKQSKAGLLSRRMGPQQLGVLAVLSAQRGQLDRALALLQQAIAADPGIAELQNNLGMTLYSSGRIEEAISAYERAIVLRASYALAHNNLGVALAALGRHDKAIAAYQNALAIQADYVEALNNLGASLHAIERSSDAIKKFRKALAVCPDFIDAKLNLAHALCAIERSSDAVPFYEAALSAQPTDAMRHVQLAGALRESGRTIESVERFRQAVNLAPDLAVAHAGLGLALTELGRIKAGRKCYETAFQLEPRRPRHLLALARSARLTRDNPDLGPILALAEIVDELEEPDKIDAHFALAKALSDIGEHHRSFTHQLAANALKRKTVSYDETEMLLQMELIQRAFTAEFIRERSGAAINTELPIFILGMPRSGSTLVEQILASHSQVHGAGELPDFSNALSANGLRARGRVFTEAVCSVSDRQLRAAAEDYLSGLVRIASVSSDRGGVQRVTDKMPSNFRYIGMIHMLLPRARIIHTRRDPLDTCLSCFSIQFAKVPYTFDLGELGRYYAAYARLMDHWRAVLPPGRMLEVQYEDLVENFEANTRRILTYCGLEWEDACLRFHETERPVRTASATQVRQPLYRDAIGRWRPDARALEPLLTELSS